MPNTKDMSKIMSFIKNEKPDMKKDQKIAIALSMIKKKKK